MGPIDLGDEDDPRRAEVEARIAEVFPNGVFPIASS